MLLYQRRPYKATLRITRPWVLRKLQPSICQEFEPVVVRLESDNSKNRAVVCMEQDSQVNRLVRIPIRLHEQFQHVWSFKLVPSGGEENNLLFYDVLEAVHAPELVREQQMELNAMLEQRIQSICTRLDFNPSLQQETGT